ncbi:wax ester/triacylglycerol synthase domain-containing protein [Lolliginicoccus levis]|uniref:wax ester/triacylglycerol synthase domain-containing protein n=1 Tax=Lolliginicoccus levis TaxID=2919542 RepID=UPI00241DE9D5|nr:wax ester/triacylglycerol synthase domain-containing protein [Lolliginicoccus levis]
MAYIDDTSSLIWHMSRKLFRRNMASLNLIELDGSQSAPRTAEQLQAYVAAMLKDHPLYAAVPRPAPLGIGRTMLEPAVEPDLARHVEVRPVSGERKWSDACRDLVDIAEESLDEDRPPWRIILLTGLIDPPMPMKDAAALIITADHAVLDGAAIVQFARQLLPSEPSAELSSAELPSAELSRQAGAIAPPRPRPAASLPAALADIPRRARTIASSLLEAQRAARHARSSLAALDPRPQTILDASGFTHRVYDGFPMPLAHLTTIRQLAPGATINDVALSVIAGAQRRYLERFSTIPERPIHCAITVALQKHGHDRATGTSELLGNEITGAIIPLDLQASDPRERLAAIARESRARKQAIRDGARVPIERAIRTLPPGLLTAASRLAPRSNGSPVNTSLANVPRGPEPMYFADAPVRVSFGLPLLNPGAHMSHHLTSLGDIAALGFIADATSLAHPRDYLAMLRDSLDEHYRLAAGEQAASRDRGR